MNTAPAISVIVPCYNCAGSVIRSLDSLKSQTFKDMELIVINDGSTDSTGTVLEQYRNAHPELNIHLITTENQGIAKTRTLGLSLVQGKYFGFLDSDDYAEPEMYQDLYDLAEAEQLEIAVSDFYWENSKGTRLQKDGPYQPGADMIVNLFAVLWNKLYRTSFIRVQDVKFPEGHHYEDTCYMYCLAGQVRRVGFTGKAYVHYVQHDNSITHVSDEQVENMVSVFHAILAYYHDHQLDEKYHFALEYITIKTFVGNNFLRAAQIEDAAVRRRAVLSGWDFLNQQFPQWHANPYLHSAGGLKNRYFRMVNDGNLMLFAWLFHHFGRSNL